MSDKCIVVERVNERDIDLLLMRLFVENKAVCALFLPNNAQIISVAHSVANLHGESDIVVKYLLAEKQYALLIENKIDAPAQEEQNRRYSLRGDLMMEQEEISDYSVWIVAPQEYLYQNNEAQKYDNKVSYEEILKACESENDIFSCSLLRKAIEKKKDNIIIDDAVTAFWLKYYEYRENSYPHLKLHKSSYKKGSQATWPDFETKHYIRGTKILHKSEKGYVDLEFRGKAEDKHWLARQTAGQLNEGMDWVITGKSASIRMEVPKIDFSKPFENYLKEIKEVFEAVDKLDKLAKTLTIE